MNSNAAFAPRPMVIETNGFTFDALAAGPDDGALVLLLHGFPQFADAWTGVMGPLAAAGYRAVAVTQRGYSRGARPLEVSEYSLEKLVADVLGFADALGAPQFHLMGHDWGGAVAWTVAVAAPQRLLSLSVLAMPHLDAFSAALRSDLKQQLLSAYMKLFQAPGHVAETALLALDAKLLRGAYQGKLPASQVEANVRRLAEDGALTAALNWYRALGSGGGRELGPVRVPTLYVWGDKDLALGEVAAVSTAKYVAAPYRFERMAGKSHWLLEECPEEIAAMLLAQVKGGEGPRSG